MAREPPVGIILHDNCALAGAQKFLGVAGRCLLAAGGRPVRGRAGPPVRPAASAVMRPVMPVRGVALPSGPTAMT